MRSDNGYSRTAEGAALLRALEQREPFERRILEDPFAASFLQNRWLRIIVSSRLLSSPMRYLLDLLSPGAREMITLRGRLVDDLATGKENELEQVVILGAGFDTMALRVYGTLRNTAVFEVDHLATQSVKQRAFMNLSNPANIQFVPADFERDDFVTRLAEAGFEAGRSSLIVWLGVLHYLTAPAVHRAMSQIAMLGGPGTRLVFDYMLADVVQGTTRNRDALAKAKRMARMGEPWLFGLTPEQVPAWLVTFGFRLLDDYGAPELQRKYCPQRRVEMDYMRLVVCERV
jgi:methyltransferase (TIGR00027 family)